MKGFPVKYQLKLKIAPVSSADYSSYDIWNYTFRCACSQTCMSLCACMYICVHTCVPNLYLHVTIHISDMSLYIYASHIANMTHTAIILKGHLDPKLLHMCAKSTTICNIYFRCHYHVCASNKCVFNATYIPNIQISSWAHVTHHITINISYELWSTFWPQALV